MEKKTSEDYGKSYYLDNDPNYIPTGESPIAAKKKSNAKKPMVKVTEKEMAFLEQIKFSDYSGDGFGFTDYITDYDYDMKVVRGLIPSLVEKGIIVHNDDCGIDDCTGKPMASAYVTEDYMDIENHKFIGLEVV